MEKSNRAEQLWRNWEQRERQLVEVTRDNPLNNPTIQKLKYAFLREGLYRIGNPSAQERLHFSILKTVAVNIQKRLYPNPFIRLLHKLKTNLWDKPRHIRDFTHERNQNLQELKTTLRAVGLGSFSGRLENRLDYETVRPEINMTTELSNHNRLDVKPNLVLDDLGHYSYEGFHATHMPKGSQENSRSYTFPVESGITVKQAANLLEGRSVRRSFESADGTLEYKWQQLDFNGETPKMKEFHSDYNYDMVGILSRISAKIGVRGLTNEKLIKSLEHGDYLSLDIPGKGRFSLQADPAGLGVNFFDRNKKQVNITSLFKKDRQTEQTISKEVKTVKLQQHNNSENQSLIIR